MEDRYRRFTGKNVASKQLVDRDVLFDILVPEAKSVIKSGSNEGDTYFRTLLNRNHGRVCRTYFEELESPDNFTLTVWASVHGGIVEEDAVRISQMPTHDGPVMWFLKKLCAALPEEGKGKAKSQQGGFERWTRKKARFWMGRSD